MMCALIRKYQLTFGLIFSLISSIQSQDLRVDLRVCNDNSPIEKAYVLNEANGKVLGYSNKEGRVIVFSDNIEWPLNLKIYKMSALDTSLVLTRGKSSVCLNPNSHQLSAFEVISEKEDIAESFRSYIDKTVSLLKDTDTTHYFSFVWNYSVPDSNWNMHMEGVIKMPVRAFSKEYSGGYGGKFCRMTIILDSSLYLSNYLEKSQFNHTPSHFTNHGCVRKKFVYRKKIADEMVLKKVSSTDSTWFIYSAQISKNWLGKDWKIYVGYPVFNKDSILVQNESELQLIDTIGKQKEDFAYLREFEKAEFAIIDGDLVRSAVNIDSEMRHESGVISNVIFNASLITDDIDHCEEVYIMKHFTKKNLDQLNKLDGYQVILK